MPVGCFSREVSLIMDDNWQPSELTARALLKRCARHIFVLGICSFLGLIAGMIYLASASPEYTGRTTLMIEWDSGQIRSVDRLFLDLDTHALLLKNRTVLEDVVRRNNLLDIPEFFPSSDRLTAIVNTMRRAFGNDEFLQPASNETQDAAVQAARAAAKMEAAIKKLERNLSASRAGDSRLLNISYRSKNPVLSTQIANSVSEIYVEFLAELIRSSNPERLPATQTAATADTPVMEMSSVMGRLLLLLPAATPTAHSAPNIKVVLAIFTMLGFFLGAAISIWREFGRK